MKQYRIIPKLLAILCVVALSVLFLSSCSLGIWNVSGTVGEIDWRYEKDSHTLTISGTGPMPDFAGPDDVAWASVREHVESLEIEEGVTTVGDYAFYYMPKLQSTVFPASLTSFGDASFAWCSSLSAISVPQEVVSIGERAFEGCNSLTSMYLPQSVTSIGKYAFSSCYSLGNLVVTAPTVSVDAQAFRNCLALKNSIFRSTVTQDMIAVDAFEGTGLTFADIELSDKIIGSSLITIQYLMDGEVIWVHEESCGYGMEYAIQTPKQEGYDADIPIVRGVVDGNDVNWTVSYRIPPEVEVELSEVSISPVSMLAAVIMIVALIGIGVVIFFSIRSHSNKKKQNHT